MLDALGGTSTLTESLFTYANTEHILFTQIVEHMNVSCYPYLSSSKTGHIQLYPHDWKCKQLIMF